MREGTFLKKTLLSITANFSQELLFQTFSEEILFHSKQIITLPIYQLVISEGLGVLSRVSIIVQSRAIGKVYLISRLHKVLRNCYF